MSGERRGMTFPAHHLVGADLSFTCTNCGGHTSTTPPCIPAKTYPTPEPSEVAETTAGEREPYCTACLMTDRQCEEADGGCCEVCRATGGCSHTTEPDLAPAEPDAGEVEALAKVVAEADPDAAEYDVARAVLASPWLAARMSAAETKARADERRAAWDWFGEMLKAHQYEGQPIWDEYQADRRSLFARGDAR